VLEESDPLLMPLIALQEEAGANELSREIEI
jgi:hypothetical protein